MANIPFFLDQERENLPGNNVLVTQPVGFTPPPPVSEWTWVNQGPFTAEDIPGALQITITDDTDITIPLRLLIKGNLPSPPWTIIVCFDTSDTIFGNFMLFNDGTGEVIEVSNSGNVSYYDDFATYNRDVAVDTYRVGMERNSIFSWIRIQDNGTNFSVSSSQNGKDFVAIIIVPNDDFTTPTQFGIGSPGLISNPPYPHIGYIRLVHFELTTP